MRNAYTFVRNWIAGNLDVSGNIIVNGSEHIENVNMVMRPEGGVSLIPRVLVSADKTTLSQCRIPCLNMHHCRNLKSYVVKTIW